MILDPEKSIDMLREVCQNQDKRIKELNKRITQLENFRNTLFIWLLVATIIILILIQAVSK